MICYGCSYVPCYRSVAPRDAHELQHVTIENPATTGPNEPIKQAWVENNTSSTQAKGAPPPYDQIGESWKKEEASVMDNPHTD